CLSASLAVPAADSAPAGIQMRARVLPSLRLEAGSPEVFGTSGGASAFSVAPDTIRVEVTLAGGGTAPVILRVPLTMHANVRTFLLRAHVAGTTEGEIALEGAAGIVTSRPFALRDGQVFAMASSEKFPTAPLAGSLLLTLPPAPEGETRTIAVLVTIEAPAR
ncbi:MAG: hypothetical protein ACRD2R_05845, partial [Terriglobales bacterium]